MFNIDQKTSPKARSFWARKVKIFSVRTIRAIRHPRRENGGLRFGGSQGGIIVRMLSDLAHVFDVLNRVVWPDYKDGSREAALQRATSDHHAVSLTEVRAAMTADGFDVLDAF